MRHRDLGPQEGPVLIFGGPYSNAQAMQAVLDVAQAAGIGGDRMICTGDVVAYCGAPAQTVALVRAAGCTVVAGNCEEQLGQGAADCGCGFEDGSACDLLSVAWYAHAAAQIGGDDRHWMAQLPQVVTFDHAGARYGVLHGGISDVARFIWPVSDDTVFEAEWDLLEKAVGPVDHVLAGHCGIPFVKACRRGRWINAGVIGMPPHNGRPQTRYAVLRSGALQIRELRYDVGGAVYDMERAGLPAGYRAGLMSGYWPSEDVLPSGLRVPSLASG